MILFVNDNKGILFLSGVVVVLNRFIKITYTAAKEYITQVLSVTDSM